jgi:hypothetical protein
MKAYLGYKEEDYNPDYSEYFHHGSIHSQYSECSSIVLQGMKKDKILDFDTLSSLQHNGYGNVETGYSVKKDGSIEVAVLTPMPDVTPHMWHWWFGWHGDKDNKYKLWHPQAHLSAKWLDGREEVSYINRTSIIQEYIGSKLEKAAIQFKAPEELGIELSHELINEDSKEVFICARLGYADAPLDFGWLVHQIRKTDIGSEMRSRFWLGGHHIGFRGGFKILNFITPLLRKTVPLGDKQATELLIHCSEEMSHLASFLPTLFNRYNS